MRPSLRQTFLDQKAMNINVFALALALAVAANGQNCNVDRNDCGFVGIDEAGCRANGCCLYLMAS